VGSFSYECDGRISISATAKKLVFEGVEISDIIIMGSVVRKQAGPDTSPLF